MTSIPIIDFYNLAVTREENSIKNDEYSLKGKDVCEAFEKIGFLYLKNHGISAKMIKKVFDSSKRFFDMPIEHKLKQKKNEENLLQGYAAVNQEKLLLASGKFEHSTEIRESYDCVLSKTSQNMGTPELFEDMSELVKICRILTARLLKSVEYFLDLPENTLLDAHKILLGEGGCCLMRAAYYPPIESKTEPGTVRCGEHSDYGTFSFIFQDQMGGLQVFDRNHEWKDATPIEDTIVVNVGDLLEKWTSGKFIATKHRVIIPEDEMKKKISRQSVIFFIHPDYDVLVEPFDGDPSVPSILSGQYLIDQAKLITSY